MGTPIASGYDASAFGPRQNGRLNNRANKAIGGPQARPPLLGGSDGGGISDDYTDDRRAADVDVIRNQEELRIEIRRLIMHSCGICAIVSDVATVLDLVTVVESCGIAGGLDLRFLCGHPPVAEKALPEQLIQAGADVRLLPVMPACEVIIGGDRVLVSRDATGVEDGVLALRSPGAISLAVWTFQRAWQTGMPTTGGGEQPIATLELLECLYSGYTDERAARALKLSVRTYRRRVAELCDRLGARSRFEAGVKASYRGLV